MPSTPELIDIGRRLILRNSVLTDESTVDFFENESAIVGTGISWEDALKNRICLLIGRANTGKTSELNLLKQRLKNSGKTVFLLSLRQLYEEKGLENLFAREDAEAFAAWAAGNVGEAIFLLDSIDEAELFHEKAFMKSIRNLRGLLGDKLLNRSRWIISSRPGSWASPATVASIVSELCPSWTIATMKLKNDTDLNEVVESSLSSVSVVVVELALLTRQQSAEFLKRCFDVSDVTGAEQLAKNLGLSFALDSPGDLKWLSGIVSTSPVPNSRIEAFEAAAKSLAVARTSEMLMPAEDVLEELGGLAAASVFCETNLFALREAQKTGGSIPLSSLLGHRDFAFEKLLRALPLFSDAGCERIKLVPEHVQYFLAARWLASRVSSGPEQRALVDLFRRESIAGPLISSNRIVTAGWLSCMLPEFRKCLLRFAPHVVVFFGDMAELPTEEAILFLDKTLELLAKGHPLLPSSMSLTSDDYWHIGSPEMQSVLIERFTRFSNFELCAFHLLKIFGCRRFPGVVEELQQYLKRGKHRAGLTLLCIEAIEVSGSSADVEAAVRSALAMQAISTNSAWGPVMSLIRANCDAQLLVKLCENISKNNIWLSFNIAREADKWGDDRALRYANALMSAYKENTANSSTPLTTVRPNASCLHLAIALIKGYLRKPVVAETLHDELLMILEAVRKSANQDTHYNLFEDIPVALQRHPVLRKKALKLLSSELSVEQTYMMIRGSMYVYGTYGNDDHEMIREVRRELTSVKAQEVLDRLIEDTALPLKLPLNNAENLKESTEPPKGLAEMSAGIEKIRAAEDLTKITEAVMIAVEFEKRKSTLYSSPDWKKFDKVYGAELSAAVKTGVKKLWRKAKPLYDSDKPLTAYSQTIAGLVGLQLELVDEARLVELGAIDAIKAFEYSLFEINQYPDWLLPLALRFPAEFESFVKSTIENWDKSPLAKYHAVRTLQRLVRLDEWSFSDSLIHSVWVALNDGAWDSSEALDAALNALVRNSKVIDKELSVLANKNCSALWATNGEELHAWLSLWLSQDPGPAIVWLRSKSSESGWKEKIVSFAEKWSRVTDKGFKWPERAPLETCDLLSQLYLLLILAVPRKADPVKCGVHIHSALDKAISLRNEILVQISEVGGFAAFDAIRKLAIRASVEDTEMRWLHRLALNIAEASAKEPAWTVVQFNKYAQASKAPLTDAQSLWVAVRQDVDEVIRNLVEGKFSIRKMLHSTHEPEMQIFLARELELLSQNRYSVFREEELSDGTTPDLTAQAGSRHKVRLELKQGDNRTEASLLSDLRNQLAADYMCDQDSNHGLFVVMWKEIDAPDKRSAFHSKIQRAREALELEAKRLTLSSNNQKRVEVRCFICPKAISPRNEKKAIAHSKSQYVTDRK